MTGVSTSPSRFRPQFSLGTLLWLMLVVGMATAWWNDRHDFDRRLHKLEQLYAPASTRPLWSATDILGAPDDPTGMAGKSWCPLGSNGVDWVEVSFDSPVAASTIDLHETYSAGCVTEVFVVDGAGNETSIWKGSDPTPAGSTGLFRVPVPPSIRKVQQVKICLDATGRSAWPCIDAVGLTAANGKTAWASSVVCSSVYGNGSLMATKQKIAWHGLW